jgi:hypothetical protein
MKNDSLVMWISKTMAVGFGKVASLFLAILASAIKAVFVSGIVFLIVYLIEVRPLPQAYKLLTLVALGTVLLLII